MFSLVATWASLPPWERCPRRDYSSDADWVLLGRATVSPFQDTRALLQVGKSEIRRYTAVYMQKDTEVSPYSDDLVISCIP